MQIKPFPGFKESVIRNPGFAFDSVTHSVTSHSTHTLVPMFWWLFQNGMVLAEEEEESDCMLVSPSGACFLIWKRLQPQPNQLPPHSSSDSHGLLTSHLRSSLVLRQRPMAVSTPFQILSQSVPSRYRERLMRLLHFRNSYTVEASPFLCERLLVSPSSSSASSLSTLSPLSTSNPTHSMERSLAQDQSCLTTRTQEDTTTWKVTFIFCWKIITDGLGNRATVDRSLAMLLRRSIRYQRWVLSVLHGSAGNGPTPTPLPRVHRTISCRSLGWWWW